jgi:hypothetical protein
MALEKYYVKKRAGEKFALIWVFQRFQGAISAPNRCFHLYAATVEIC